MKAQSSRAAIAGDAFELRTQKAGAFRAVFGTFGEHAEHEALELRGNCQVHLSPGLGRAGRCNGLAAGREDVPIGGLPIRSDDLPSVDDVLPAAIRSGQPATPSLHRELLNARPCSGRLKRRHESFDDGLKPDSDQTVTCAN